MPTSTRKMILWGLLGAVAVAAIAGVLAVLLAAQTVLLRVMWTGMATAVAGAMLLPLTRMLDRRRLRPAGLSAITVVVVAFLVAMACVWFEPVLNYRVQESLALTLLFVALCGVAVTVFMLLVTRDGNRLGGWIGLTFSIIAFVVFLAAIWQPGRYYNHEEWWIMGWTIGGLGVVTAACLLGRLSPHRWWRWIGVAAAVVGALIATLEIWIGGMSEELFGVTVTTALLFAYANLMCLIRLTDGQRLVRWATLAAAAGTTATIDAIMLFERVIPRETSGRLAAAGGIVTACGTLAMLLLAAFNRRADADERSSDPVFVTVVCPRCDSTERLPVGPSLCAMCGLRISIRVEEPRCPTCAYLLYRLESDVCPECGTAVRSRREAA